MDFTKEFNYEFTCVYNQCREKLLDYPENLRAEALLFIDKFNISDSESRVNPLSQMLPFWIGESLGIEAETVKKAAVGNLFGLLYFIIQDMIMDMPPSGCRIESIPLASLFFAEFAGTYKEINPKNFDFWSCVKKYMFQWSDTVMWEVNEFRRGKKLFLEKDIRRLAYKASPLKICSDTMCILSGRPEEAEFLSKAIDTLVVTFQLLDDLSDWQEDASSGNCTYFLAMVMKQCGIRELKNVREWDVLKSMYEGSLLEKLHSIALNNHMFLDSIKEPWMEYFIKYHQSLIDMLEDIRLNTLKEKMHLYEGSFDKWLSSNYK